MLLIMMCWTNIIGSLPARLIKLIRWLRSNTESSFYVRSSGPTKALTLIYHSSTGVRSCLECPFKDVTSRSWCPFRRESSADSRIRRTPNLLTGVTKIDDASNDSREDSQNRDTIADPRVRNPRACIVSKLRDPSRRSTGSWIASDTS